MRIAIRPARPSDAEALSAVIAASYSRLFAGWYLDDLLAAALPLMTRANPALLSSGTYYLAERAGEVLGCGGWTEAPPGGGGAIPGTGHIRHVATHPDHLGQGVGRLLMEHCFIEAAAAGVARLACLSTLPAEAFYARLGFSRIGPAVISLPGGISFPAVEMARDLP